MLQDRGWCFSGEQVSSQYGGRRLSPAEEDLLAA
jgi:hypothetical protein